MAGLIRYCWGDSFDKLAQYSWWYRGKVIDDRNEKECVLLGKIKFFSLLLIRGHIQSTMAVDDDSFQLLGDDGRGANDILGDIFH